MNCEPRLGMEGPFTRLKQKLFFTAVAVDKGYKIDRFYPGPKSNI